MPSIAEMLVSSGLESSGKTQVDGIGAVKAGAQLAETIENMKLNRAKLEQTKAEHSLQKYSKVTDLIKIAHESKDPAIANSLWKYAIPKTVKALGADDAFTDEFLETAAKSPETREKVLGYQLEIQQKIAAGMPATQAVAEVIPTISDPAARAALDTDRIIKAQEVRAGEEQMNARNKEIAAATLGRQVQQQSAAGGVEFDKKLAGIAATFASKDKNEMQDTLNKAERSIKALESKKVNTGGFLKGLVSKNSLVQSTLDPDTKALMDDVRGLINIKLSLGDPNPTEKQIDQVLGRIIDPGLSNEKNIQKLKDFINKTRGEINSKQDLFIEKGFMKPEQKFVPKSVGESKSGSSVFNVGGIQMSADQAKAFYQSHPQFKPDAKTKKDLGL